MLGLCVLRLLVRTTFQKHGCSDKGPQRNRRKRINCCLGITFNIYEHHIRNFLIDENLSLMQNTSWNIWVDLGNKAVSCNIFRLIQIAGICPLGEILKQTYAKVSFLCLGH